MTDADNPRVPDFRWIATHGLFMPSDDEWIQITDSTGWPLPLWLDWHRLPSDAVKLGDVEAAEAKLADIRAVLAENYNPNLERWRFPGEVLDLIRAVLDREPGREEPTATLPDRSGRWVDGQLQPFGPYDLDGWQPTHPEAVAGD